MQSNTAGAGARSYLHIYLITLTNILNRPSIDVSAADKIIHNREDENCTVTQHSPIHIHHRGVRAHRKEAKYPDKEQEQDGNDVDGQPPFSQIELGRQERLAADPL